MEKRKVSQSSEFKAVKEVSVMAWIENQFGSVLLLKQKRGNRLWTLPGGKVTIHESLVGALRREVREETGLEIQSIVLSQIFERAQKGVITFLFRAQIKGKRDTISPQTNEIATGGFSSVLPGTPTPSLKYFWSHMRSGTGAHSIHPGG